MILIAPDKYRGTLTAPEAARLISRRITEPSLTVPMADGGEGTASAIAAVSPGWQMLSEGVAFNKLLNVAAVDSSLAVGYIPQILDVAALDRNTAPLADLLNDLYRKFRPSTIFLGVGGTAVCDGGQGLLRALLPDVAWREILVGLIDVRVPLLPCAPTDMSALSFCRQKGYTEAEITTVRKRLEKLVGSHGSPLTPYAGAGGGLGYALADIIGAKCFSGAEWLLDNARIAWNDIECVITGEGRYDSQTTQGKVVGTIYNAARSRGIPVVCLAGCIEKGVEAPDGMTLVDLSHFLPHLPLTPRTAAERINQWRYEQV